jgi:ornithine carbamoyltransferase
VGAKVSFVLTDGMDGTARMLGRLYDAVDCEGLDAQSVELIERDAAVPVFTGLADPGHSTGMLAVLLGLAERCGKPLSGLRVAYIGNAAGEAGLALLQAAARAGMELHVSAPPERRPAGDELQRLNATAEQSGAHIVLLNSADEACAGVDTVLLARDLTPTAVPAVDRTCTLQAMLLHSMA